jgi:hypothetical protein
MYIAYPNEESYCSLNFEPILARDGAMMFPKTLAMLPAATCVAACAFQRAQVANDAQSPRAFILASATIALLINSAVARDANGFWMGGGVGGLGCPEFLNAMATARQKGGLRSAAGVQETGAYENYVSGFQTGFNSEAEGVYEIFKSLGTDPTLNALYAIEPWCAGNPDKKFAHAVLALASTLRRKFIRTPDPRP